jgi:ABC-type multidrug transport system permease subunit
LCSSSYVNVAAGQTQFIVAEILAEIPYLIVCGTLFAVCWLPPTGLSFAPKVVGPVFLTIYVYELLYTGIGQFVAA